MSITFQRSSRVQRITLGAVGMAVLGAAGGIALWQTHRAAPTPTEAQQYTSSGFGGYTGTASKAATTNSARSTSAAATAASTTAPRAATFETALGAYRKGHYKEAEVIARKVLATTPAAGSATSQMRLKARRLTGFALARRGEMAGARQQFATLAREAATAKQTPNAVADDATVTAKITPALGGWQTPGMTEDALYQHAVCTLALGDKAGAERKWIALMQQFPESPLVHASVKRIARLHGGDIPHEADAAWKQAMATARARENERQRQASLCGPQTLAEVLRRRGNKTPDVEALAKRMHTSESGTSLADLGRVAKQNGFTQADGFALTRAGLAAKVRDAGPNGAVVALVDGGTSGHFVLVDGISDEGVVTVWDSNGAGLNQPQARTYTAQQWQQAWQAWSKTGMALVLK